MGGRVWGHAVEDGMARLKRSGTRVMRNSDRLGLVGFVLYEREMPFYLS